MSKPKGKRGRPKKKRPTWDDVKARGLAGLTARDIAATGVMSRQQIDQALAVASIPDDEFEALIEGDGPAPTVTALAARGRAIRSGKFPAGRPARKSKARTVACPHCGGPVLIDEGGAP